ncbi:MAG TPA: hypothetical protein VN699_09175 [Pirellulales bacterium]|nr:hypothetical protein [Pirellulales bacterium]
MASKRRRSADPQKKIWPVPPVRKLDAAWLEGRVAAGYWEEFPNRRRYMWWLGQRLGFKKIDDWYRITTNDFKTYRGAGVLYAYWNSSAIAAVQETFPDYDWKEWLFRQAPLRFWSDRRNHRRYMAWLAKQLNIRRPQDWYRVSNADFEAHKGGAFLLEYNSTISAAIMAYAPRYDWKEWLFSGTPKGFWDSRRNRRRYLEWLGAQLGYKKPDDWYAITQHDFYAHRGIQFLKLYNSSPMAAVRELLPKRAWKEWMFARVPVTFWDDPRNRRRYLRWLGQRLGFKKPADWQRIRRRHFLENCGGGLLAQYASYVDLLKEYLPPGSAVFSEQH